MSLLQTEGGRLRRYFSEVLRQHETYPALDVVDIAAEQAAILPVRMQNLIVYALAAKLVRHVACLRNPRATPDELERVPAPLRLDSAAAQELLNGLKSAPRPRGGSEPGIIVRTTLELARSSAVPESIVRREIVLPRKVSARWLADAIGRSDELPPRLYLSLLTSSGSRQAVGTATLQDDEYLLRSTVARGIVRPSSVTEQLRCIVSFDRADLGEFVPQGGEALCDTPWSFDDDSGEARLRSTGNWHCVSPSVLVALPSRGHVEIQGESEALGDALGLGRAILRLRGALAWTDAGDRVEVASGSQAEGNRFFELRGRRPPLPVRDADAWLGVPEVIELNDRGVVGRVPPERLQWRVPGGDWTRDVRRAVGAGELAVTGDGIEFRARLRILPADLRLSLRCRGAGRGTVEVRSAFVDAAGVAPSEQHTAAVRPVAGGFDIDVEARTPAVFPPTLTVSLRARNGIEITTKTPFPAEQLSFIDRDGRALTHREALSLDDLAHVRAVAISPLGGTWAVDLKSDAPAVRIAQLPQPVGGLSEVSLEPLRSALAAALAANPSLDHSVDLLLVGEGAVVRRTPTICLRRYDAALLPEQTINGENRVVLAPDSLARLGEVVVASLRAEAIPLLRPDSAPTALPLVAPGRWSSDVGLAAGAWLVLVYQNDYLRTRPLRITIPGAAPPTEDEFVAQAMAQEPPALRRLQLDAAIAELGNDTSGPGWSTVRMQVSTLGRYPAGTFDVVRSVSRCHRVAVLSLLDAGHNARTIWSGLEDLPFLWATTPVSAWLHAIRDWLSALRGHVPITDVERIVAAAAPGLFGDEKLAPFLHCVHDAAFLLFQGIPDPRSRYIFGLATSAARAQAAGVASRGQHTPLSLARSRLLSHHLVGFWPSASPFGRCDVGPDLQTMARGFDGQPRHQLNVLQAPLLLAERVLGRDLPCDLFFLRQVRDFDPEWFDFAFALSLSLLLGRRYELKEAPFHE